MKTSIAAASSAVINLNESIWPDKWDRKAKMGTSHAAQKVKQNYPRNRASYFGLKKALIFI